MCITENNFMNLQIKDITEWEVLTPNGWSNFDSIKKITKSEYIKIYFYNNKPLKTSLNHKIKLKNNSFKESQNLKKGDITSTNKKIKKIELIKEEIDLYDLMNVEKDNEYITNNITSHNCAFINGIEEIYTAIKPTISTGGGAIALSSPNGIGNWFHKIWSDAEIGDNDFLPIKLPWDVHPERDDEWFKKECANMSRQKVAQEYECSFIGSGHTVFPQEIIEFIEQTTIKDPIEKRGFDQNYWLWSYPNYSRDYMVIGDVARGDGKDFSTIQVMDIENNEQVAEWKGQLPPKEFANLLISVASEWNNALLICENTGIGWSTVETLLERNYSKLYFSPKGGEDKQIENYYHNIQYIEGNTPGFSMTLKTRPLVINKLREFLLDKSAIIHSKRLIEEIKVFIWKNGRGEAQSGYNDDLIMGYAIGQYLRDISLKLKQQSIDFQRTMLQNTYKVNHAQQIYKNNGSNNHWQYNTNYGNFDLREWL